MVAALRAADLGARTTLVTRGEYGGMAANDGPVPVRTLAHAARLLREARQLPEYGVAVGEPGAGLPAPPCPVRDVVGQVRAHSALRANLERLGVTIHEHAGATASSTPTASRASAGPRSRRSGSSCARAGRAGSCPSPAQN